VTDAHDRRTLSTLLSTFCNASVLEPGYLFAPETEHAYTTPAGDSYASVRLHQFVCRQCFEPDCHSSTTSLAIF
jgi:hypothetical protein